jgi:hypothetical protein
LLTRCWSKILDGNGSVLLQWLVNDVTVDAAFEVVAGNTYIETTAISLDDDDSLTLNVLGVEGNVFSIGVQLDSGVV